MFEGNNSGRRIVKHLTYIFHWFHFSFVKLYSRTTSIFPTILFREYKFSYKCKCKIYMTLIKVHWVCGFSFWLKIIIFQQVTLVISETIVFIIKQFNMKWKVIRRTKNFKFRFSISSLTKKLFNTPIHYSFYSLYHIK